MTRSNDSSLTWSLEVKDQAIAVDSINAVQWHITLVLEQGVRTGEFRASSSASLELAFISGVMAAAVRQMALDPARTAQAVSEATVFISEQYGPDYPSRGRPAESYYGFNWPRNRSQRGLTAHVRPRTAL